jgi:PAS domain S-box-containing protein
VAIPVVLVYFVRRRKDVPFTHLFWLFGAFILGCGFTHFMDVVVTYTPLYWLAGFVKLFTALVSAATVAALVPIVPRALALRSPEELEREIAERKRAEKELQEKNQQLVKSEQLKSQFLANVSHELRTPLTLILGPLEGLLATDRGAAAAVEQATLRTVHNNAVRLLQIVNGLLDFSKLEAGKVEVMREPIEVENLTRTILTDFQPLMLRKGLTCRFEAQPLGATVLLDRYLFERILFNLLSNAVKFSPAGATVAVSLAAAHDRLRLTVTDTGIGIAEENLANLFQKFRQLEGSASRRFEGTGLGLALVKEFAELLEGRVEVNSRPGQGSTFTVDCSAPAHAPAGAGQTPTHAAVPLPRYEVEPEASDSADASLPKVLIVEDNVELAGYVARLLRGSCQTQIAGDSDQALALIRASLPDLILADVMMPTRDGLSLCREVKADPASAGVPVVLVTALTHREALLHGWEAGADEYLFKPFHPTELLTRVRSVLAATMQRRESEEERLRIIVETANEAFIKMDASGKITWWSPKAEATFGWQAKEVIGRVLADTIIPAPQREAHRQGLKQFLATGEGPFFKRRLELTALHRDGHEFPVEINVSPRQVGGTYVFNAFLHDISERKRFEEALARSNTELQQFAYVASHNLQEPLRAIAGFCQLLADKYRGQIDAKGQQWLAYVVEGAKQMQELVQGLLRLSRVESEGKPFVGTPAANIVGQALQNLEAVIQESGAEVVCGDLPSVEADPWQLVTLFQNLIGNAMKFRGKERSYIQVSAELKGTDWVFQVRDNGIGIDPKHFGRLFVMFQRLHRREEYPGTGIGLALCKRIVERHGGRIWLESEVGKGSTFFFSIPTTRRKAS